MHRGSDCGSCQFDGKVGGPLCIAQHRLGEKTTEECIYGLAQQLWCSAVAAGGLPKRCRNHSERILASRVLVGVDLGHTW